MKKNELELLKRENEDLKTQLSLAMMQLKIYELDAELRARNEEIKKLKGVES